MKKIYIAAIGVLLIVCAGVVVYPYMYVDPYQKLREVIDLYSDGESERALVLLDHLLKKDPEFTEARVQRGVIYSDLGDARAIEDFDQLIRSDDQNPYYWQLRGNYYQALGAYNEALADYDHSMELLTDRMRKLRLAISDEAESWKEEEMIGEVSFDRMKTAFYLGDLELAAQHLEQLSVVQVYDSEKREEILFFKACIDFLRGTDRAVVCETLLRVVDVRDPFLLDRFEQFTGERISAEELLR